MPDVGSAEILLRLVLAAVLGGAIGLERELRDREAGLRTHLLVAVGAALFTMVSAYAWTDWAFSTESGIVFDPTRIAAQIVTGVGFLGAGAIIRQGLTIRGLTTAATLWIVAAIGMAAGTGYYVAAIFTTALVLVSLGPLRSVAHRMSRRVRRAHGRLVVELRPGESGANLLEVLTRAGARPRKLEFTDEHGQRRVEVDLVLASSISAAEVVADLLDHDEIVGAAWAE